MSRVPNVLSSLVLAAGLAACALPVIRLALIAPAEALRHD